MPPLFSFGPIDGSERALRYRAARKPQESAVYLIRIRRKVQDEVGNPNGCAVPKSKKRIAHTGGASTRMMSARLANLL